MLGLYSFSLDSSWAVGPRATRGGGEGSPCRAKHDITRWRPVGCCGVLHLTCMQIAPGRGRGSHEEGEGGIPDEDGPVCRLVEDAWGLASPIGSIVADASSPGPGVEAQAPISAAQFALLRCLASCTPDIGTTLASQRAYLHAIPRRGRAYGRERRGGRDEAI